MKIIAATGNEHKLREFREILEPVGVTVLAPHDVGGIPEVEEDRDSFLGNAIKKAVEVAAHCKLPAMADDSGLEVYALNNQPGVYSARYAGERASDAENLELLLQNMHGLAERGARFRCVIAVADTGGRVSTAEGTVNGEIIDRPKGGNGFGYDPVFVPEGYNETFGELAAEVKNNLSHRSLALHSAVKKGLFDKFTGESEGLK